MAAGDVMMSPAAAFAPTAAERERAIRLADQAVALATTSGWPHPRDQSRVAGYYLRGGRCELALPLLPSIENGGREQLERLLEDSRRGGTTQCTVVLAERLVEWARDRSQPYLLNIVGAYLRQAGQDEAGQRLIREAEAAVREEPLTRSARLWSFRWQALQVYRGSAPFDAELRRTVQEFLASPPGNPTMDGNPAGAPFAQFLFERGERELGERLANEICVLRPEAPQRCDASGYIDADLDQHSQRLRSGSLDEQIAAMHALSRNRALERIAPHFSRMVQLQRGSKRDALSTLAVYGQNLIDSGRIPEALEAARQGLALTIRNREARDARGNDIRDVSFPIFARILAAAGQRPQAEALMRHAPAAGTIRTNYFTALAAGLAQSGDLEAARLAIARIEVSGERRRAWRTIAMRTPRVAMEHRMSALEQALAERGAALPQTAPNVIPSLGSVVCGEDSQGARLIAAEGATAEEVMRFGAAVAEMSTVGAPRCAYRRFLLDAVEDSPRDERARTIALELVRTTEQPCGNQRCEDSRVLRLLLNLEMYDEAERLAMAFEETERVQPLLWIAETILNTVGDDDVPRRANP